MRGIVNGVLFSLPLWAGIALVWHLYPPTTFEHIVIYSGLIAGVVLVMAAFVLERPERADPPCPDRYLQVLPPLGEHTVDDYDKGH